MLNISIAATARVASTSTAADKGFVAKPETYDQIYAFAGAMGWMEKPFHWVVNQWMSLPDSSFAKDSKRCWLS